VSSGETFLPDRDGDVTLAAHDAHVAEDVAALLATPSRRVGPEALLR